jgi:hypothetical protein
MKDEMAEAVVADVVSSVVNLVSRNESAQDGGMVSFGFSQNSAVYTSVEANITNQFHCGATDYLICH